MLRSASANSPIHLKNSSCIYCGGDFEDANVVRTKEHVVARQFVPKGTLNRFWNLIVFACLDCNNEKSELEDDLSAITMQPDVTGRHAVEHEQLAEDAKRKGKKAFSRTKRAPVQDSGETADIKGQLAPGLNINFNMCAAPQVDEDRAHRLAWFHVQAFWYFVTFDDSKGNGAAIPGQFILLQVSRRSDWGNDFLRGFMGQVYSWRCRFLGGTAQNFFKVAIRDHPQGGVWSWALEWNHSVRVVGLFGDESAATDFFDSLPKLKMDRVSETVRIRTEKRLSEAEDLLFRPPL